jgi:hypothetical protein
MMTVAETDVMFAIAFLIGLVALCVLGGLYGADSRHDEPGRHRRNLYWRRDSS